MSFEPFITTTFFLHILDSVPAIPSKNKAVFCWACQACSVGLLVYSTFILIKTSVFFVFWINYFLLLSFHVFPRVTTILAFIIWTDPVYMRFEGDPSSWIFPSRRKSKPRITEEIVNHFVQTTLITIDGAKDILTDLFLLLSLAMYSFKKLFKFTELPCTTLAITETNQWK